MTFGPALTYARRFATLRALSGIAIIACALAPVACAPDSAGDVNVGDAATVPPAANDEAGVRPPGSSNPPAVGDAGPPPPVTDGGPTPPDADAPVPGWPPTDCTKVQCRYVTPTGSGKKDGSDWSNALAGLPADGNGITTTLERGATYFIASGSYPDALIFRDAPASGADGNPLWITLKKAIDSTRCTQLGKTAGDCHGTDTGWSEAMGQSESTFGSLYFARDYYTMDGQVRDESMWSRPGSYGFRVQGSVISSNAAHSTSDYGMHLHFRYLDVGGAYGDQYAGFGPSFYGFQLTSYKEYAGKTLTDMEVSHCYVHNVSVAVFALNTDGVKVESSYMGPAWSKEGIRGNLPSINWTIRNNQFVDACQGTPDDPTAGSCTATIACFDHYASTTECDNWTIYGNLILRTPKGRTIGHSDGIILGGAPDGATPEAKARNWTVYNNVFADLAGTANGYYGMNLNGPGHFAVNNIWFNLGSNATAGCSSDSHCQKNWCSRSSCGNIDLTGTADPFVNASGLDFHLKAGTDPVNAGVSLKSPFDPVDPSGRVRGSDGSWDIGIYEYSP